MNDFNTGARRPVNDTARAKRLSAAEALVRKTLSQHGLATLPHVTTQSVGQSLGDLMQSLLPNGIVHLQGGASDVLDVPDEAQFLSAVHQARSGSRAYRTYVPASAKEAASGIVMMLHGCTQTPEDFAIGTGMNALADHHGFIVIYPEQSRGSNAQTCWNWFSPGDQRRDRGEPEILAGIAREAMSQYGVASDRTFVRRGRYGGDPWAHLSRRIRGDGRPFRAALWGSARRGIRLRGNVGSADTRRW